MGPVARVRGVFRAPRWPRALGAVCGFGAGVALTGAGVGYDLLHNGPLYYAPGYLVVLFGSLAVLVALGIPSVARVVSLFLLAMVLVIGVPYGFRSAVLDLRGERVLATVVEVKHGHPTYTGSDNDACRLEARGDTFWVKGLRKCGPATRPGDRFEVLRDPEDLVAAFGGHKPVTFPILIPAVAVVVLLLTVLGARGLRLRAIEDRAPSAA